MHHPVTLLLSIILLIGIEESVAGENATPRCNDSSVCKKATAKMLQFMDHSADPCKGFHKYVCGNRNVDMNPISKDNVEKIEVYLKKNNTTQTNNTLRIFMDFYRSCVDYDPSFGFMKKMEFIRNHTTTDLTALFTELILTQSMPFFDIGMDINKGDQTYVFQITLPGMRTLKTDLDDWYVFQKVEKECEINVENSWLNEPNKDGLRWLLKSLEEIREKVPEGVNTSPPMMEKIPIDQLDDKFGVVSWRELFRGLTANSDFIGNEMIQVHFPDYLKGAFDLMKEKHETGELMGILQEFSSFQLYSNIFRTHENKKMFCMDLSQQLMPDITTKIHYELMDPNQNVTMQHFNETFVEMKKTLHNSLQKSIFTDRSKKAFKQKLDDLQLGFITHGNFEITAENYEDVLLSKDYKKDVLTLLKNYRKMIYSLAMASSTAESLLTYFVSPFLNKPKTFYHSSFVGN
ncbi:hypothetical protein JTB14_018005 [Gonioctena quinquepunctata]|nr:hypothetical protein JTB14_018005 [Gonioctena quinquepunctata]